MLSRQRAPAVRLGAGCGDRPPTVIACLDARALRLRILHLDRHRDVVRGTGWSPTRSRSCARAAPV